MAPAAAQIWRDDGGVLFGRLRAVAQRHMDCLAADCDARWAGISAEPRGAALVRLQSRGLGDGSSGVIAAVAGDEAG